MSRRPWRYLPSCEDDYDDRRIIVIREGDRPHQSVSLAELVRQKKQEAKELEDLLKGEKKDEKKEEKGVLKGLTRSEIFLVMLLVSPFVGHLIAKLYKSALSIPF